MKILGAHLSISKGLGSLYKEMKLIEADTCAIFLKSPRQSKSTPLETSEIADFKNSPIDADIIVPHGSYLINLANPERVEKNYECLKDDVERCHALGIKFYNLHPGSDVKKIGNEALILISEQLNRLMKEIPEVVILIENMAGAGNTCGRTFEELKFIIDRVTDQTRIGVTLDTCHMLAAGYDIRTEEGFTSTMEEFDKVVGRQFLKAVHLNDSKYELGSRKDRHEQIGEGQLGIAPFEYIMNSPYFEDIPMILETRDPSRYKAEINLLRKLIKNPQKRRENE